MRESLCRSKSHSREARPEICVDDRKPVGLGVKDDVCMKVVSGRLEERRVLRLTRKWQQIALREKQIQVFQDLALHVETVSHDDDYGL